MFKIPIVFAIFGASINEIPFKIWANINIIDNIPSFKEKLLINQKEIKLLAMNPPPKESIANKLVIMKINLESLFVVGIILDFSLNLTCK